MKILGKSGWMTACFMAIAFLQFDRHNPSYLCQLPGY